MYGAVEVFSIKAGDASVLLGSVPAELYNPLSVCLSKNQADVEGNLSTMTPLQGGIKEERMFFPTTSPD